MAQMAQQVSAMRNTNVKHRCWSITINNYTDNDILLWESVMERASSASGQTEIGKNGTPHIQAFAYFNNGIRFSTLRKLLGERAHIEKARNINALRNYVLKNETRDKDYLSWSKGIKKMEIRDRFIEYEPKEWQKDIINMLNSEPDDRTINWIWDSDGGTGKTTLAKHICLTNKRAIYVSGKASDIKYGITQMVERKKYPEVCIFDLVRSGENYVSYEGIEAVKNGIFFNAKYESNMVMFNNPHVVCFANYPPDYGRLSKDRWNVFEIVKGSLERSSLNDAETLSIDKLIDIMQQ